jgi:hypothetical protein
MKTALIKADDIVSYTFMLPSGNTVEFFLNPTFDRPLVVLSLNDEDELGGHEFSRNVLDEKEMLRHLTAKKEALALLKETFEGAGGHDALVDQLIDYRDDLKGYYQESDLDPDEPPTGDVRLRFHAGEWSLLTGDPQYDTDHRGYWASGVVLMTDEEHVLDDLAERLFEDVVDMFFVDFTDPDEED